MTERVRGRAGQRMRERRLKRTNGLCERCLEAGRTRPATRVDHVLPLAQGGLDVDENTRNLCEPCHREVTAEQFDQQVARGARGIARSGRPTSPDHPWNARPGPAAPTDAGEGTEGGRGRKPGGPIPRTPNAPIVRSGSKSKPKRSGSTG